LGIAGPAPWVEGAALIFRREQRLAGVAMLGHVGHGFPLGGVGTVEPLRIVPAGDIHRPLARNEGVIVVADQRHGDAVGNGLFAQMLQIGAAILIAVVNSFSS
jgi:hypothetical protein